jgi:hypothetical protein
MKSTLIFSLLLITILFNSCSRTEEIEIKELTDAKKIAYIEESGIMGVPFPEQSKAIKIQDDISEITLPDDVYFVAKITSGEKAGQVIKATSAKVTCTCSKGTGCSPVLHKGSYYCVMNSGCTVCSMSTSSSKTGESLQIVGVIDERTPVAFYAKKEGKFTITENTNHKYPFNEDFFKNDFVKKEIDNIFDLIYGENIPNFIRSNSTKIPENYVYAKVNFFGNDLVIPIPKNSTTIKDLDLTLFNKVSCSCGKGKGCTLKSIFGTSYCEAGNCTVCSLIDNSK